MNGKQRILSALKREQPDSTPLMLHHFMHAAAEDGLTMRQFRDDPGLAARALSRHTEKYGLDAVFVDVDTALLSGACGVPLDFPENNPAHGHGRILEEIEDVEDLSGFDVSKDPRIQATAEIVRLLRKHFGEAVCIRGNADQCPFSLASMLRGTEDWMIDLLDPDSEDLTFRLLDLCLEATKQFVSILAEAGADVISNGDSPAGPEMISPAMYRKFALPYETKVAEHSRALGCPYIIHICGNTTAILADVVESGADGFEIDYKTDVNAAREALKGKVTFLGNIDPSGVLTHGTPEIVTQKTEALLDLFRGESGFILNSGCSIPPTAPEANLRAMLAAATN